jgi:hypothetical protein
MDKLFIDQRKWSLDWKYIERRNLLSTRFWQTRLLECFKLWNEDLKEKKEFNTIFKKDIYNVVSEDKVLSYIEKDTYNWLMSLFWKFNHFYDKYLENIELNLLSVDSSLKNNQKNIWEKLLNKLDYINYLKNKFWDDIFLKIDKLLLKNMNPEYSNMSIYEELWNAICDLEKEFRIEISEDDKFNIRAVLSGRYDEEWNVYIDKLN